MSEFRFGCTRCGKCCRQPGFVFFSDSEIDAAAALLRLNSEAFRERFLRDTEEGWALEVVDDDFCAFLVDDACTIATAKPQQCRTYPFWPEISREWKTWLDERPRCPGIGLGRVYSEAERRELEDGSLSTDENY